LGKMFVNIDADKGIRGIVGHKEIGINMIEWKKKCERMIQKHGSEVEVCLDYW
jgi:hypothetical protein